MDGHVGHGTPQRRFATLRWSLGGALVGLIIVAAVVLSRPGEAVNIKRLASCLQRHGWARSTESELPIGLGQREFSAIGPRDEVDMESESASHLIVLAYQRRDEERPAAVLEWRGSPEQGFLIEGPCERAAGAPARP